jgi:hypothetical protein
MCVTSRQEWDKPKHGSSHSFSLASEIMKKNVAKSLSLGPLSLGNPPVTCEKCDMRKSAVTVLKFSVILKRVPCFPLH